MPKNEILKPDIKYPKTIYVTPFEYQSYSEEDWEATNKNDLGVYDSLDDAAESSDRDEGETWIAVYELKEMVRVKKTVTIKDKVAVK